jgi:hypothetical protein
MSRIPVQKGREGQAIGTMIRVLRNSKALRPPKVQRAELFHTSRARQQFLIKQRQPYQRWRKTMNDIQAILTQEREE